MLSEDEIEKNFIDQMSQAAKKLGRDLYKKDRSFMLIEPTSLVVKTEKEGWVKMPHTGGEDFSVIDVSYSPGAGDVIVYFSPNNASTYVHMECPLREAVNLFPDLVSDLNEVGWSTTLKKIIAAKINAFEVLENEKRAEIYGDEFGEW